MTNEPIDWTQPIELATEPPRPARQSTHNPHCVWADWDNDGVEWALNCFPATGEVLGLPDKPRVRNVRPGEVPAEPAPDLAAELAEALQRVEVMLRGNWTATDVADAHGIARTALAKWDARK